MITHFQKAMQYKYVQYIGTLCSSGTTRPKGKSVGLLLNLGRVEMMLRSGGRVAQ